MVEGGMHSVVLFCNDVWFFFFLRSFFLDG